VAYLNGSKVLTTGSALTFDGTNLGVGISSPGSGKFQVKQSLGVTSDSAIRITDDATTSMFFNNTASGVSSIWSSGSLAFGVSSGNPFSEAMRLTSTGLGIGTSSPDQKLTIVGNQKITGYIELRSANRVYFDDSGNTAAGAIWNAGTGATLSFSGDGTTEQMRLNSSGNLGIGTSSPGYKLEVAGTSATVTISANNSSASSTSTLLFRNADGNGAFRNVASVDGATAGNGGYGNLVFSTAFNNTNTERARIDASGNLGLGVTPSAWSGEIAFQVGRASIAFNTTYGTTSISANQYGSATGRRYIASEYALQYDQQANTGAHAWFTAPSGTAGNAISFTQAATLTAAGEFLVGQTAVGNGGKLSVNGSISLGTSTTGAQSSMAKDTTQLTTSVSTSATTIYTDISSGMSSASAGYFIIHGSNNAGAGFMDVVIAKASGTPVVVSSSTVEGSPAARTYSVSSFALQLAMASGTFNINLKATVLGHPF
jgi:hypothetical protein